MGCPRVRFTVRRMMIVVAVVAVIMGVVVPVLEAIDAMAHGPYATAFNHRCQALAKRVGLLGSPESDVVKVLGEPTWVWRYSGGADTTYNYAPCPFVPHGVFQVHCGGGVVKATEQLDD